jgi:hypothetical protein
MALTLSIYGYVVFSSGIFLHYPAAETHTQTESNLTGPFKQSLAFYHVSELGRLDAQLVNGVF